MKVVNNKWIIWNTHPFEFGRQIKTVKDWIDFTDDMLIFKFIKGDIFVDLLLFQHGFNQVR